MTHKKFTIKDIAKLSGVSEGTVDRVLHKRGSVSKGSFEKVEKILKEINFRPNPIARNLRNNKIYRIGVLIPDTEEDHYWIPAHQGIKEAAKEFEPFGILVDEYFYSPRIESSFIKKSDEAIDSSPDAILMAPLFQTDALVVYEKCQKEKIPIVLFNNYIDSLSAKMFIGQDLYLSGRVAASLIAKMADKETSLTIVHINLEPHMHLKERGFKDYFSETGGTYRIDTQIFDATDEASFREQISQFSKNGPDKSALFITNSKAYKMINVMGDSNVIIVGYDLLEENIVHLRNGRIDYLIHQKPKRQAYLGISYLSEHFLFGKKIPEQELLPIDIITSENYICYTNL